MHDRAAPVRIDKWLWAARFTKTRALAAEAVKSGRVQVNGQPAKPARDVKPGDRIEMRLGPARREVIVQGTVERRVSAPEAAQLYEETPESVAARERAAEERRLVQPQTASEGARPTKRDRRRYERARGRRLSG